MGRKIPGRKHRGVRDPEKQAEVRFNSIKDKINAPPSNPSEQQIPWSLQRIIDLKNKVKNGEFNKKRKKQNENSEDIRNTRVFKGKPEKTIPLFKQRPGEADRIFVRRMNKICMEVTREAKFEEKYGVDIKRNEDGEVEEVVKRPKDELEILLKKVRKQKKEKESKKKTKKNKTNSKDQETKSTKSQKWALKKKLKKLKKKSQNVDEFQKYKDDVKFGETVHAPPSLTAPRKAEQSQNGARPGKKSLLLNSIINSNLQKNNKEVQVEPKLHKVRNKVIDKKGKRKDLPHALRRQLENQQKEIVDAYKVIKAKKYDIKR